VIARRILALALMFVSTRAFAEEHIIDIFRPEKVVHPIAIAPFQVEQGAFPTLSTGMPDAIGKDLEFTGLFKVIDRAAFLEKPGAIKPDGTGNDLGRLDDPQGERAGARRGEAGRRKSRRQGVGVRRPQRIEAGREGVFGITGGHWENCRPNSPTRSTSSPPARIRSSPVPSPTSTIARDRRNSSSRDSTARWNRR